MKHTFVAIAAALALSGTTCIATARPAEPGLVPWPKRLTPGGGTLRLPKKVTVGAADPSLQPLAQVVVDEINSVAADGVHASVKSERGPADITLQLSPSAKADSYTLSINNKITVTGQSAQTVAEGTATLIQAIASGAATGTVEKMTIIDAPDTGYRGLMIDLARDFHPVSNLQQIIEMCRLYKIRYLHLHLSDDQSFTFPSTAYPAMATPERSYSHDEMTALVAYADVRGVTIVPEIDMPAHASSIIKAIPELSSPAGNIINFADPVGIKAACTLVDEMAEMFPNSPYIHIGGDEANLNPLVNDPKFVKAIADQNVGDIGGLFNAFINTLDDRVKSHHKRTIAWEGLSIRPPGPARVHDDVIIEPFDNYQNAQTVYIDSGHDLINTSWFPMYVLKESLFGIKSIYDWDLYTFGNYKGASPRNFEDVTQYKVTARDKVLGAQVCSWEQGPTTEIPTLRRRLATMSERTWNRSSGESFDSFSRRLVSTDAALSALLTTAVPGPVTAAASNAVYPDRVELLWTAPAEFPSHYTVLRGTSDEVGSAAPIAINLHDTQFTDRTAVRGTTYHYWVKAGNHFGVGEAGPPATGSRGTSTQLVSAYEGFAKAAGSSLAGVNDGTGWAGPWEAAKDDAKVSFKPVGLTYPGLKTTGGCLNFTFANDKDMIDVSRPTTAVQGVPGTRMWMSFLLRANKVGDGHFLAVSNASSNVAVGKQWGNGVCIYGYSTNVALVAGKTYLIVVRYDCMTQNDVARIWVDPPLNKEPDIDAPGVAVDPAAAASSGTKFGFSSQGYGQGDYDFDELRLGATWKDVLPGGR